MQIRRFVPSAALVAFVSVTAFSADLNDVLQLPSNLDWAEIRASDSLNLLGNQFSFEAWIKPAGIINSEQTVFAKVRPQGGTGASLRVFGRGASLAVNDDPGDGSGINLVFGGGDQLDTNWHHVAATYDGTVGKVYIDGTVQASQPFLARLLSSSQPLTVGREGGRPDPLPFVGSIDELRVWSRALSQDEIQKGMWHTLIGNETGLIAYFNFDDGSMRDKTPFGNDGILLGHPAILSVQTPFPRPVLTGSGFSVRKGFRLDLFCEANTPYLLESSPDLRTWTRVTDLQTDGNLIVFVDPNATNSPARLFYRASK